MDTIKIPHKGDCKIIAHRGVSGLERENTCAAFVAAGNRTYFGVETDIYRTADGKFAVCHDGNLKRVGGVDIACETSTLAELRAVTLFDTDGVTRRADLVVPELWEYIAICKKYDKHPVLELKSQFTDEEAAAIVEIIRGYDYLDKVIFISFIKEDLLAIRRACPEAVCQYLPAENKPEEILAFCVGNRIDLDAYHVALTREIVEIAHSHGLLVNCWTVDTVEAAERVLAMGVDFITTNILE